MVNLTKAEGRALLKLFKDFNTDYNANSLSKQIDTTPRGALKILKKLESSGMLIRKQQGKAVFYKINFNDYYTTKIIETLLIAEAKENASRWSDEFKEIYEDTDIVLLFGSITRNQKEARDIDVLFVYKRKKYKKIRDFIEKKNKILFKKIHDIPQTMKDLKENLIARNVALIDAVRTGYVLHGEGKLIEVIKNVTRF